MAVKKTASQQGRASRNKGKRGERMACEELSRLFGWRCRRTQQFSGKSGDAADIVCEETPSIFYEIKRVNKLNVPRAMATAANQAGRRVPVLLHRPDRCAAGWMLTIKLSDLPRLCHAYQSAIEQEIAVGSSVVEKTLPSRKTSGSSSRSSD